jgi:hypothetical protein
MDNRVKTTGTAKNGRYETPEHPNHSTCPNDPIENIEPGAALVEEVEGTVDEEHEDDEEYDGAEDHQTAPLPIQFTGDIEAEYHDPLVTRYRGNPCIEALPRILSGDEATDLLEKKPPYVEEARKWPTHLRIHEIRGIQEVRIVLPKNLLMEQMLSCAIRDGLVGRNPLRERHFQRIRELSKAVGEAWGKDARGKYAESDLVFERDLDTGSYGFTVIGISGGGKTAALAMALSLLPRVIIHSNYNGKALLLLQLPYIKLECPRDGSIRGLLLSFFKKVDEKLGTKYFERYTRGGRATVDEMVEYMVEVSLRHALGLLCIDEIQNLVEVRTSPKAMLDFLVQLNNSIGVPVVLVGNYKAGRLFKKGLSYARRGSGQGAMTIHKMEKGLVWEMFLKEMWQYQYTRTETPLSRELLDALYDESQGIPDIAIKILILAQARAMALGAHKKNSPETITPAMIKWVARNSLQLLQPVLEALRTNDFKKLDEFDDVTIDMDALLREIISKTSSPTWQSQRVPQAGSDDARSKSATATAGTVEALSAEGIAPAAKKRAPRSKSQNKSLEQLRQEGYFEAGDAYL